MHKHLLNSAELKTLRNVVKWTFKHAFFPKFAKQGSYRIG